VKHQTGTFLSAIAAISMMAAQISPAAAFTLSSAAVGEKAFSPQIEKVWGCRWGCGGGWGWRGGHWGFWGPAVAAGVVTGAVVGAAVATPYPCWRRVVGPYGGVHWARVC
jgi:hypothetical protein